MQVHRGGDLRLSGPRWLTMGVFDGVHAGHRALIGHTIDMAGSEGAASAVVTINPNPLEVLAPHVAPLRLGSLEHRLELLAATGVDEVVVLEFTRETASVPAEEFAQDFLFDRLGARGVVIGSNFRFGRGAAGDPELLRRLGAPLGVQVVDQNLVSQGRTPVSSTEVRRLIGTGDVASAAVLLGRPHVVEGPVGHGAERGRDLGFPTANLEVDDRYAIPPDGVYAGQVEVDGRVHPVAVSIGTNPTFDGGVRSVEGYLLDFDGDLYGRTLRFGFLHRLRDTLRFANVQQLVDQMHIDVAQTRTIAG